MKFNNSALLKLLIASLAIATVTNANAAGSNNKRCSIDLFAENGYTVTIQEVECKPNIVSNRSQYTKQDIEIANNYPPTIQGFEEAQRIMGYTDYFGIPIKNGVYTVKSGEGIIQSLGVDYMPHNKQIQNLLDLIQSELELEDVNKVPAGFQFEVLPDRIRKY